MAVVIASSLRKEHSGDVLFDGVSFKVERKDRLAPAGPNRAGKKTLWRRLAGHGAFAGGGRRRTLGGAMAAGDHKPATMRRYSEAQARLEHAGGYDWRDRAASVVR